MAYTCQDFKSKKALKDALTKGVTVRCYNPGIGPDLSAHTGMVTLEGPHYPAAHSWYGQAKLENGVVKSVK